MKKFIISICLIAIMGMLNAQNLQLHYDFGEGRQYLTSTVELFKPDKIGSTFFFIDMDYDVSNAKVKLAYWEIARDFKFKKCPIMFHTEYNGGFGQTDLGGAYQINSSFLNGLSYSWNSKDYSKGITFIAAHKFITQKDKASFQLTAVWYLKFWKNRFLFTGFADFWKEKNDYFTNADLGTITQYVFLSEPQLWYNITKKFAVGTEIEIAANFALHKGFKVCPTLGVKYIFND